MNRIFNLLDDWRHLPDYQLERRADIFFAAWLPAFLAAKTGIAIYPKLIPEFPLRLGTLYPEEKSNQSCKVDFLALTTNKTRAFLIELKTDNSSRRDSQDKYLQAAKSHGLPKLLEGVLQIVQASDHKHKYCRLLRLLESVELLRLPHDLDQALASSHFRSKVNRCLANASVTAPDMALEVLYLQPVAKSSNEIGFVEFADWLERQNDSLGTRFAASLRGWTASLAGHDAPIAAARTL